ncbi:MAG: hypothetical protein JO154_06370 [Chitinophaga sp.]|uniref:hypothetical protein n=1 Tax=Chitinophaga sp. TaxID=1869181 RepID=UPI0025BF978A|nr:hypothetical protein [Chitinophaga sp.]MBV8252217.1 hypothetical protein [Chitinophaga sp.]
MKKVLLLAIMGLIGSKLHAQEFKHGVGTGFMFSVTPGTEETKSLITLNYYPRVNIPLSNATSIAVGVPLGFGFGGSFYTGSSENSNSFNFEINAPVMAEFNFGAGAVKSYHKKFGAFVGAGFGMHYQHYNSNVEYTGYPKMTFNHNQTGYGPAGSLGVRFGVGRGMHNIEIRTSYMRTLGDDGGNIVGTSCLFNF